MCCTASAATSREVGACFLRLGSHFACDLHTYGDSDASASTKYFEHMQPEVTKVRNYFEVSPHELRSAIMPAYREREDNVFSVS